MKKSFARYTLLMILLLVGLFALTACFSSAVVLSFNAMGGTDCEDIDLSTVEDDITLPDTTRDGYTFTGWYTERSCTNQVSDTITKDDFPTRSTTYYAGWEKKIFTITFAVGNKVVNRLEKAYGETVVAEDFPSLELYEGYYWETEVFTVREERTFYAKKTEEEHKETIYTVTYIVNGQETKYSDIAYTKIDTPDDPTAPDGYYFAGWSKQQGGTVEKTLPTYISACDVTYYAVFVAIPDGSSYLTYRIENNEVTITGLTAEGGYQTVIGIPASINDYPVTAIGEKDEEGTKTVSSLQVFHSSSLEKVIIPEGVKTIGAWAFSDCTALSDVVFAGSGVTYIGKGAFAGCSSLAAFTLGNNTTVIGDYAFAGMTTKKTDTVAGEEILANLPTKWQQEKWYLTDSALSSMNISASSKLSQIGAYAFYRCYRLTSVTLPSVMNSVNYLTYIESGLQEITVRSAESCALKSVDGAVYSSDGKSLEYYPVCGKTEYTVRSGVVEVKKNAFRGNRNLVRITFPATVTKINDSAFCDCEKLTDITFASGSALTTLGESVFAGCTAIEIVSFPEKLVAFGAKVFENDTKLKEVLFEGSAVTGFGDYAFYGCTSLAGSLTANGEARSFIIPKQVSSIGHHAFEGCCSLTSLTFRSDAILLFVGDYAFCDCVLLGKTDIPSSVQYIGDYAFCGKTKSMAFTLSQSDSYAALQYLGSYAFSNTALTGFQLKEGFVSNAQACSTYQKDTSIGKYVFKDCTALTKLGFSSVDAYDTIPEGFAYGCTKLTEVILQQNIKKIGSYAFYGCSALTLVTFSQNTEWMTQMVTEIGDYAFAECVSLQSGTDLTRVLPSSLETIGVGAYEGCKSLLSIAIPENLQILSKDCFKNCTSLSYITYDNATSNQLSTLGENCFANCTSLGLSQGKNIPVSLPYNLASRGTDSGFIKNPFYGCSQVFSFAFPAGHNDTAECTLTVKDGMVYQGTEIYAFPTAKISTSGAADVVIPSAVSAVQPYAFYGAYLRELEVAGDDNTVVFLSIGDYAFSESKLTTVTLEKRVVSVGAHAFENCNITQLEIKEEALSDHNKNSNIMTIGDYAFSSTTLSSVTVPYRVSSIGKGAFQNCYKLSTITFKNNASVTLSIGENAFSGDNALLNVVLPERLVLVDAYAFYKCYNIKTVTFTAGQNNLAIGAYAFAENQSLYELTLPSNIASLGTGVFSGCSRLYYFYYPETLLAGNTKLSIPDEAFLGDGSLTNLTVPSYVDFIGKKAFYRTNVEEIVFENGTNNLIIGESAFAEAPYVTEVYLPNNCKEVGKNAFRGSAVKTVGYDENGLSMSIGEGAFAETPLEEIELNKRIEAVGKDAFQNCTALTEVIFDGQEGLIKIEDGMFRNDQSLQTVTLGSAIQSIGKEAFRESGVKTVSMANVSSVDDYAFYNSSLQEVSLAGTQMDIGVSAFEKCASLRTITVQVTGNLAIGNFAFGDCGVLSALSLTCDTLTLGTGFAYAATSLYEGFAVTESNNNNNNYVSEDYVLYDKNKTKIVFYPAGKTGSFIGLAETVTSVGDYAFYGNTYLTGILIGYENGLSTATLGEKALDEMGSGLVVYTSSNLVSVYKNDWGISNVQAYSTELNSFVLTLQNSGKYYITGYLGNEKNLTVPGTIEKDNILYEITGIGKNAFQNNKILEEVEIGAGIKTVGNSAFRSCIALQKVTIGKNVTAIKNYAFYGCDKLQNVLFTDDSSVSSIGDYSFSHCAVLTSIDLPERLDTIGEYAFSQDVLLSDVSIEEGLKTLSRNAFEGCTSLEKVELPSSLEKMGSSVFRFCTGLIYIRIMAETVPTIEINTFDGISAGVYFLVPGTSVKSYGLDGVWRNHIAKIISADYICKVSPYEKYVLEPIEDDEYRLVAYIGSEEEVTVTSQISEDIRCVRIGENAFGQFVKNLTISEGVEIIESNAFTYATSLQTVTVSSTVQKIDGYAFANLPALTSVIIDQDFTYEKSTEAASAEQSSWTATAHKKYYVKSGDNYVEAPDVYSAEAVYYKKVRISALTSIADHAFYNCTGMQSFEVPASVLTVGEYAFSCDEGKTMNFTEILFDHEDLDGTKKVTVSIGAYAFARNAQLETITFNAYVSYMGEGVFQDCTTLVSVYFNYATEKIATYKTTDVAQNAQDMFKNCDKLCVILPSEEALNAYKKAWANKGIGTFDCNHLFAKTYVVGFTYGGNYQGEFLFSIIESGTATLISYLGDNKSVVFPSSVVLPGATTDAYKVIRIGRENNGNASHVNGNVISDRVEEVTILSTPIGFSQTIGADAFRGCKGLKKITVEGERLETVEAGAFKDCIHLETVILPCSLATIGKEAFAGCEKLEGYYNDTDKKGLSIGEPDTFSTNGVKLVIGESAFASCTGMTKFILLPQVTTIGSYAFDGCKALTEVCYKDKMYAADKGGAILGKESLMLATIGEYAFRGTNLYDMQIPETVSTIGNYAFSECQNLSALYLYRLGSEFGNRTTTEKNVFYGVTKNVIKIFVPDEKSDYANMTGWKTDKRTVVLLRNIVEVEINGKTEKFAYEANASTKNLTLTAYLGTSSDVEIPTTVTVQISGESVTCDTVGVSAYFGNSYMRKVTFTKESHVSSIGAYAFAQCQNLKEIHLPASEADSYLMTKTTTEVTIGEYAFENCTSLQDVHMPLSVKALPIGIFYDCTGLEELTLPESIGKDATSSGDPVIGASAFYDCYKLARLRILFSYPLNAKTVLGASAFVNAGRDVGQKTENGVTTRSGLKIIVPSASYENFAGQWQSNNNNYYYSVYSDALLFGDYLISLSADEKEVTLVQYLGNSEVIALSDLNFSGKELTALADNCFVGDDITVSYRDMTLRYEKSGWTLLSYSGAEEVDYTISILGLPIIEDKTNTEE